MRHSLETHRETVAGVWELSVRSSLFFCKSKTVLEHNVSFFKKYSLSCFKSNIIRSKGKAENQNFKNVIKCTKRLRKAVPARSISGACLDFAWQQRSLWWMTRPGPDCLHDGVILSALLVIVSWRMEDGEPCAPLFHDWVYCTLRTHVQTWLLPLWSESGLTLLSPRVNVSPHISDNAVKSLVQGSWWALPVCLSVASPRRVSQRARTPLFVSVATTLQCSTWHTLETHMWFVADYCGRFVLTHLDFAMCRSGKDLKMLFKPNAAIHLFPCF